MASSPKHPKSSARRSLPIPSTRVSSTQLLHQSSQSTSSIPQDLLKPGPRSSVEVAPSCKPTSVSKAIIVRPTSGTSQASASSTSSVKGPVSKLRVPRRSESTATSSIGKLPIAPRTQGLNRPSTSSTAASPTRAFGFLTPAHARTGRSGSVREGFSTPKGPQRPSQADFGSTTAAQTPSKKAISPYANAHVADPCIPGCLIHQLSPCGHKVMTKKPEPCASNCRRPNSQQAVSTFTNILQSTEAFVCAACVELHVQSHRDMKRELFTERMDGTELQMGGFPEGWRDEQNEYWQRVRENDAQAERTRFESLGRKCYYIPGQPIVDGEVQETLVFTSVPSPWPPSKRPLVIRKTGDEDVG